MFTWNLRRLQLGCPVGLLTKKDIAFRRCLFWVPGGTSHKKRHCLSAMSLLGARWDSSQKKTLPIGDVSLGARWDSSQKKTLPFGDVSSGCPVGLLTKKRHCLSAMSLWGCPVGLGRSWWFLIILNILLSIEYQLVIEYLRFIKIYKKS